MTEEAEWQDVNTTGPAVVTLRSEPVYELTKYVYVISKSQFVLKENPSNEKRYNKAQFNLRHQELKDFLPQKANGDPMEPSEYVFQHCYQTNVVNHIDMHPAHDLIYLDEDSDKVFNIFPPNVPIPTDIELPDPKPFLDHLLYIYNGNQEHVDHVLKWMASVLFRPEKRTNHGILTSGDIGTGKSMMADVMRALLHERAFNKVEPRIFLDRFQDWIEGTRLAVVEEVAMFGQGRNFNKVKEYFTGNRFSVNPKGKPAYKINNFVHYMFFSNHVNPMPIEQGDRRLFYVHSRAEIRDTEYYDQMFDDFLDPHGDKLGCFAFAKYLRDQILPTIPDTFETTRPPETRDKIRASQANRSPLEEYLEDKLEDGRGIYKSGQFLRWKLLKADIKENLGLTLGRNEATSTVLQHGFTREMHMIHGKKEDLCWRDTDKKFDEELQELFKDTSMGGRAKLKALFYEGRGAF
jgi:hypothetical protein